MYTFDLPKKSRQIFFHVKCGSYKYVHNHKNYWEFMVIVSGEYVHRLNGKEIPLTENTLCVIRPNDVHSIIAKDEKQCKHINIGIRAEYLQQILSLSQRNLYEKLLHADSPQFCLSRYDTDSLVQQVNQLLLETNNIDEDRILLLFLSIFHVLLNLELEPPKLQRYGELTSRLISLISNPDNLALDLQTLIEQTGYSYSHANHVFLQETKQSLSRYFRQKKMSYAQKLLANTNYSLDTISQILGYSSPYAFSYSFKTVVGCSPSQFADRNSTTFATIINTDNNSTPPPQIYK